jgi:RNA polymerase sigma factor (sigma-70 family)
MDDHDWLAQRFEEHRPHLRAVAYRLLGSAAEADDAVQEAWLRLSRAGPGGVENLGGWLTTVVGRVSLDMLRSRRSRARTPSVPSCPRSWRATPAGPTPRPRCCWPTRSGRRCWSSWRR